MEKNQSKLIKSFEKECKIINLQKEYPQYHETVKYVIISKLTEDELVRRYGECLIRYKPYCLMNIDISDVLNEYWKNENKYRMRYIRNTDGQGYREGQTEQYSSKLIKDDFSEKWVFSEYLKQAMKLLTPLEKERLIERFYKGKTLNDIANEHNCSVMAIKYSIDSAIKKMRIFFEIIL